MNTATHSDTRKPLQLSAATGRLRASPIRQLFALMDRADVISLAGGFPPVEAIDTSGLRAAIACAARHSLPESLLYGPTQGYAPLRELIADRVRVHGGRLGTDEVLMTSGSQQAIDLVARTTVDVGDTVLVEAPTYLGAIQAFRAQGARLVSVASDDEGLDTEALERALECALETERPTLLYVIPNFANPTGRVLSLRRRKHLLSLAVRYGLLIIEDDPYGELYFREPPPPSLHALATDEERQWIVHLSSFSKVLSPGLRLAWMTAPESLMTPLMVAKQIGDTHTASLSQLVAYHYLRAGSLEPALARTRAFYRMQSQAMQRALERDMRNLLDASTPAGGMFVWARTRGIDTSALLSHAISHGVAYVPGAAFHVEENRNDTLRLAFTSARSEHIEEGIARLARAMRHVASS